MPTYTLVENLFEELDVPQKGFTSRTIHNDDHAKIIVFSFATGAELAAHKAPMPIVIQILQGEGAITIDDDVRQVSAGFLVCLPPDVIHSVTAKSPVRMLLTLWKRSNAVVTQLITRPDEQRN